MEIDRSDYLTVTQVLNPYAGVDKIPTHILQVAASRGTQVHTAIAGEFGCIGAFYTSDLAGYMESFHLVKKRISNVSVIEERYYDDTLKISGQCDLICDLDGIPTLIDWKTSAKEGSTWRYQLAAYDNLARTSGIIVHRIIVAMLDKYGNPPKLIEYSDKEFTTFLECLKLYRIFFSKKKEIDYESI